LSSTSFTICLLKHHCPLQESFFTDHRHHHSQLEMQRNNTRNNKERRIIIFITKTHGIVKWFRFPFKSENGERGTQRTSDYFFSPWNIKSSFRLKGSLFSCLWTSRNSRMTSSEWSDALCTYSLCYKSWIRIL
jgi:hypothetical protein